MGCFLWVGRRFRTAAADLDALWAMLPEDVEPGDVTVIMEPTRTPGCRSPRGSVAEVRRLCLFPQSSHPISAPITASTPRPIVSTRACWPGCPCCIPRGSIQSMASVQETLSAGQRDCARRSSSGEPSRLPDSMRCLRFSVLGG